MLATLPAQPPALTVAGFVYEPKYVGDVGTGFTGAELDRLMGRLRHPSYLGLRDDKPAQQVTVPKAAAKVAPNKVRRVAEAIVTAKDIDSLIDQLDALEKARKNGKLLLPDGDTLEVTNLHKIFWPRGKQTKGDLVRHYAQVAPYILPVINNRAPDVPPPGVRSESLPEDDVPSRLIGGSLKTLLYMAQLASISMDPWFSTMADLDPQPGATFSQILDVARWVQEELDRVNVPGFPKTSGSEGLHIFIPLPKGTPYHAGMLFCQIIATMVAMKHPKVAGAYSARASTFAGVSTPLTWNEVHESPAPQDFTIDTIAARLAAVGDLWAKLRAHKGANLLAAIEKLSK